MRAQTVHTRPVFSEHREPRIRRVAFMRQSDGSRWRRSMVPAAIVVALHTTALYALTRSESAELPSVSVPITVSLVTTASEPTPVKPTRPRPPEVRRQPLPVPTPVPVTKVAEPMPEPERVSAAPSEPSPAQVIAPRFDAAYLNNPVPAYPSLSRKLKEQGRVLLNVFVKPDGTAGDVQISTSSGSSRLDRAAKEAVERWKFSPARQGAQSIGAWVVVPINFSLSQQS